MKKKIGIMTWYKYRNYGTALQCTALYKVVQDMGYDPIEISYNTSVDKYIIPENESFLSRIHYYCQKLLDSNYHSEKREQLFREFLSDRIKETDLKSNYTELYELNKEIDTFICGSDQIWSPTRSFDDKYYLSFVDNNNKKISYAPSFGTTSINNNEQKKIIKGLIERFDSISVRERRGAEIIEDLTGIKPKVVLDPTLLLSDKEWSEYCEINKAKRIQNEEYILCYFLGNEKKYIKNVERISKEKKIPYYIIPITKVQAKSKHSIPFEIGPVEFVSLIKNASYVCTDSYHGMAFSIIYNKQFTVYKRFSDRSFKTENSRIYSLVEMLDLQDRLLPNCFKERIDYNKVNTHLNKKRTESITFLHRSIEKDKHTITNHLETSLCAGCSACTTVCNKTAIRIIENKNGFYHYQLDEDLCVNCGACKKVCPILNTSNNDLKKAISLRSLKHNNNAVLKHSSSGGAAFAISDYLLKNGYKVCGAAFDDSGIRVNHIIINNTKELYKLQGSKYIQSFTGNCYKELLSSNEKFLFIGTPCQVAGMANVLSKENKRDDAVLVELVCHGVPSVNIWKKYIQNVGENTEYKGIKCQFRDKEYSWHDKTISIRDSENKLIYKCSEENDLFYAFFNRPIAYMSSCYECQFRNKSSADIRIGDFWGEQFQRDETGVSLVVTLTKKGEDVVGQLQDVIMKCFDIDTYYKSQFADNPSKPIIYNAVLEDFANTNQGIQELKEKYCGYYEKREKRQKYKDAIKAAIHVASH